MAVKKSQALCRSPVGKLLPAILDFGTCEVALLRVTRQGLAPRRVGGSNSEQTKTRLSAKIPFGIRTRVQFSGRWVGTVICAAPLGAGAGRDAVSRSAEPELTFDVVVVVVVAVFIGGHELVSIPRIRKSAP